MQPFNFPKYSKIIYQLNPETNYFVQTQLEVQETPVDRLPTELRLAPAKAGNVAPNAARLLLSKECNKGKYKFITGIQETSISDWYLGNDYEFYKGKKVLSLMLFHLTSSGQRLEVYYFHRYDKPNKSYRMQFVNNFIKNMRKAIA